jgi:hypothetical protein
LVAASLATFRAFRPGDADGDSPGKPRSQTGEYVMRNLLLSWIPGILLASVSFGAPISTPADSHLTCPPIPIRYSVLPEMPCAGDSLVLSVWACGPCVDLIAAEMPPDFAIQVRARMDLRQCQLDICEIETLRVPIGRFQAGNYLFRIDVTGEVIREDSTTCTVAQYDTVGFRVGRCPPAPTPLPYVDDIVVGERVYCFALPCPDLACPNDSIPVLIRGTFPNNCFHLRRIELVPSDITAIGPPTMRVLIDDRGCLGRPCIVDSIPWSARVLLPPLPPGNYNLPVEVAVATCTDSFPDDSLIHRGARDFRVVQRCSLEQRCFRVSWGGPNRVARCDAIVSPGHPARLALAVAPRVALAGLQGELVLDMQGVRITQLSPIGYAQGMRLQWRTTERGARFVLFAESGAPIPPYYLDDLGGWPVLAVTVESSQAVPLPERTRLFAVNMLGADSTGGGVDECPHIGFGPVAIICSGSRCDMNADGIADVRDLVLMVHCVLGTGLCPDTGAVNLDCDENGLLGIEDVLCCARFILHGDMPDSIAVRPEPGIDVNLGEVRRSASGLALPFVLNGTDRIGAARLALSYPADRFDVSAVELPSGPGWLSLSEIRDGKVVIGLIATSDEVELGRIEMLLRLALKPGQVAGGQVRVVESDFSGRDGVALAVDLGQPARTLASPAPLALSASRPNPFSGTTRFSVELGASSDLEVTVHDLSGRHVTHLHRGRAVSSTHELIWDGRSGDGSAVPSGIYFIRAEAGGNIVSCKVVLLRDR